MAFVSRSSCVYPTRETTNRKQGITMGRILIVDDEPNMRRILASNLRLDKHDVSEAVGVDEARRCLAANDYDAVFIDQRMPDGDGLEVLAATRESDPTVAVVFLTAVATIELAVESM